MSASSGDDSREIMIREIIAITGTVGVLGLCGTLAEGFGPDAIKGFMVGGLVSVIASQGMMRALRYGPWLTGLMAVSVPTLVAGFVVWSLRPVNSGPVIAFFVPFGVFSLACLIWWLIARKRYGPPPPWACPQCAYDRRGLEPSAPCPECGGSEATP